MKKLNIKLKVGFIHCFFFFFEAHIKNVVKNQNKENIINHFLSFSYLFDQEITNNCFFNKTKFLIFKKGKIKE